MPEKEYEMGSIKQKKHGGPPGGPPGGPGGGMSGEKAKNAGEALKKLVSYCRSYLPAIVIALILGAISAVFSVIGPEKISEITDLITEGLTGSVALSSIVGICVFLAVLYGLSWLFGYVQNFILATVTQRMSKSLRTGISQKINRMPLRYFDRTSFGDVLSRVTNDVDTIGQMMNNSLGSLISSVTLLLGALIMMFATNVLMAASAVAASLIGFAFMMLIIARSQKYLPSSKMLWGRLTGISRKCMQGSRWYAPTTVRPRPSRSLTR